MKKLLLSLLLIGLMSSRSVMAFEPFVVKDIRIEGVQRISKEAVLQDLPVTIGEELTQEKSNAAIHMLFKSGFYKNVTLERDGNTLVVKVVERPSIGKLELVGLKSKEDVEKILKENNVAVGRVYDPSVISKVEKEIIHKYLTQQRYGVRVDTKVIPEERNRVTLEMHIYEGTIATIKEIRFVGNHAFTERQLRSQMYHKTKNILSWLDKSDHYSKEKLAADLEMIRSFYMDRGYINFKIESTQVSLSVDKKFVYLTINVHEGEQYFFKNITLAGDFVIPREELQDILHKYAKPGAVFSRKAVWEAKEAIEERLGEEGYSKANVRLIDDIDQEKKLVNLKFYIDAGKRITIRRITFEGNALTEDKVLRRGVEQFEGAWISTKKVKESKENLRRDGYVSEVDIQTVPVVDKDDQVDLLYKVEEQRTAQVTAGISYSASDKWGANAGAELKNFVGTGKDINFLVNYSTSTQTFSLGYANPYFTDSGVGMAYNIYNQRTNLSKTSHIFDFNTDETGFNIGWQLRLSQYTMFRFGGGYDHTILHMNYFNSPMQAKAFVQQYNGVSAYTGNTGYVEYFVNCGWQHNSLDSYLFATKGYAQSLDLKADLPAGDFRLYKIDYDISWFKALSERFVLNLRGDIGFQNTYNNMLFPFFKNYFLGGGDTVRGFEERSLGPLSSQNTPFGGNFLIEGRAQIIFPPPFFPDAKNVRTALFLDAGQVYDMQGKEFSNGVVSSAIQNPKGIRYSAGVSLTWNTPLNMPIAFSFAWPLNKKPSDQLKIFAFSLGTQF